MWNKWVRMLLPCCWVALMTWGRTEQSSKNWQKEGDSKVQWFSTILFITGDTSVQYFWVKLSNFNLVSCKPWHIVSICFKSSIVDEHAGDDWQKPVLLLDQWLQRSWVLYRPETILHCMVAIAIFAGDDPAVDHIGCGLASDIYWGWKKISEERLAASVRRTDSQWLITWLLISRLYGTFGMAAWRSLVGCGRSYLRHISLICLNQDLEDDVA